VRIAAAAAGWLLISSGAVFAQPSFAVTFGGTLDSFSPSASATESRQNLSGAVNLEHLFAKDRARVAYDLGAGDYDSPGNWTFLQHNASFTYQLGGTGATDRKLFVNTSFVARANGDAWTNAEYAGVGAGMNAELHPAESTTIRAGYRADFRRFADFAALTQFEHRAFASLLANFPSRTTVVAEFQVGAKHYNGAVTTETGTTDIVVSSGSSGGRYGQGSMNSTGMATGSHVVSVPVYSTTATDGAAGLTMGLARVAQSLTDRTGIHVQATVRRTFGSVTPLLVTTPAGFFEDGVYDDPFAANGVFLQAGFAHAFAGGAELSATGWWADKDYTSIGALDPEGLPLATGALRADRVTVAQAAWSQPLWRTSGGDTLLSADISYRYMRHASNDTFYNYRSHAVGISLTASY
jgi:hypothetical protein